MSKRIGFIMLGGAMAVSVLLWGGARSDAQTQATPDTTIVDAAGRAHRVMPMRKLTQQERKAAAQRAKATRSERAGHKKQKATAPQQEVAQ